MKNLNAHIQSVEFAIDRLYGFGPMWDYEPIAFDDWCDDLNDNQIEEIKELAKDVYDVEWDRIQNLNNVEDCLQDKELSAIFKHRYNEEV